MEYAGSYALFNYRLVDEAKGLEYDNLRLIRAFECGLDPSSSEAGFVLVHIAMVKESGALISGAAEMLNGCSAQDREQFDNGLRTLIGGLKKVNAVMNSECPEVSVLNMRLTRGSDVEEEQAQWVHEFPYVHLRHHKPVDVSQRCRVRGRERGAVVVPRRVWGK